MKTNRYLEIHSAVHRWDPRWKLVSLLTAVFTAAGVRTWTGLGAVMVLSIVFVRASRIPFRSLFRILRYPVFMLLLIAPLLIISSGGETAWRLGPLRIYRDGLIWTGTIFVRSLSIMSLFAVLFMSTRHDRLFKSLEGLRVPAVLVLILMSTYRFIFLFVGYLEGFLRAARLRGFSLPRGMMHARTSLNIMVSLLVRGLEQVERTSNAMRLRGLRERVAVMGDFRTAPADIALSAVTMAYAAGVIAIEVL